MLYLIADGLPYFFGAVGHSGFRSALQYAGCEARQIAVTAGGCDVVTDRKNARRVHPVIIRSAHDGNVNKTAGS